MRVAPATGRTPPSNVEAEESVLGAMLLSEHAISAVLERVRADDFYRPAHRRIFDVVIGLFGRGEAVDTVTVCEELRRSGTLEEVGGKGYLLHLVSSVPAASNAAHYARIVEETALLRRLIDASQQAAALAFDSGDDVEQVVDQIESLIFSVAQRRMGDRFTHIRDLLHDHLEQVEALQLRGSSVTGVATGFLDMDKLTSGLQGSNLVIIAARPSFGKALALDTPLPTPAGWTTMGEVRVGDYLLGPDGKPTRVVAATEVMDDHPCYAMEFSDGEVIVADADHLWLTTTRASRRAGAECRPPSHSWSEADVARVVRVAAAAAREPDRLVSTTELLQGVGEAFRHVLRTQVITQVPAQDRQPRPATRRGTPYLFAVPACSRQPLTNALAERVTRPVNSRHANEHASVVTTAEIAATLWHENDGERRRNHAVANCQPLQLPDRQLPLSPYLLGVWLGDGTSTSAHITSADTEIADHLRDEGYRATACSWQYGHLIQFPELPPPQPRACAVCGSLLFPQLPEIRTCGRSCGGKARTASAPVPIPPCPGCGRPLRSTKRGRCQQCRNLDGTVHAVLRTLGVLGDKRIPQEYLRASESQRRDLLAGLLDTDGTVSPGGSVQFTSTNGGLADAVRELVVSLGYRCRVSRRRVKGRSERTSTAYTVSFATSDEVFRLGRKRLAHRERYVARLDRTSSRFITGARPVASVPVRCIRVDNDSHLYLAGRSMIPTHNTSLALNIAQHAATETGTTVAIFSLEMSKMELVQRLVCAEALVDVHKLRTGNLSDQDWTRLGHAVGRLADAPIYIDDTESVTVLEIRAKARRLKQKSGLGLVIIDYLQLMSGPRRSDNRQQEISEISRSLKILARELDVPVIAVSQLSRAVESRSDKRPMLADLRDCLSGDSLVTDADTGARVRVADIVEGGLRFNVWALDEECRLVRRPIVDAWRVGPRETFRVTTKTGRTVVCTSGHRFRTVSGWRELRQISAATPIAVPRTFPPATSSVGFARDSVLPLGWLIGDKSVGGAAAMTLLATSDVLWDPIVAIEPAGVQATYDVTVAELHNLCVDDFVTHNSGAIEQDADVVCFIYRDEVYNSDSQDRGVAEVIVAKHRNGPVGTIKLTFLPNYTKFANFSGGLSQHQ